MADRKNSPAVQLSPSDAVIRRVQMLEYLQRLAASPKAQLLAGSITAGMASIEYEMLSTAEVFTWRSDILDVAFDASRQLPAATLTHDLLPSNAGLFLFPRPIRVDGVRSDIVGLGFLRPAQMPEFVAVFLYESRGTTPVPGALTGFLLKFGADASVEMPFDLRKTQTEYEVAASTMGKASTAFLVASFLWMQQRVLLTQRLDCAGSFAKHSRRLGVTSAVNVVVLRRPQESNNKGEQVDTEWSCQWFVRGHWRQQYLPSTQTHRPTWIQPYVKGPEDKPLKAPSTTVFSVSR